MRLTEIGDFVAKLLDGYVISRDERRKSGRWIAKYSVAKRGTIFEFARCFRFSRLVRRTKLIQIYYQKTKL